MQYKTVILSGAYPEAREKFDSDVNDLLAKGWVLRGNLVAAGTGAGGGVGGSHGHPYWAQTLTKDSNA